LPPSEKSTCHTPVFGSIVARAPEMTVPSELGRAEKEALGDLAVLCRARQHDR